MRRFGVACLPLDNWRFPALKEAILKVEGAEVVPLEQASALVWSEQSKFKVPPNPNPNPNSYPNPNPNPNSKRTSRKF